MPSPTGAPSGPYRSSREHVLDELARFDAVLRDRISAVRDRAPAATEPLAGYFIPEAEIDELLQAPPATAGSWCPSPHAAGLRRAIDERVALTVAGGGVQLRLVALGERFGLDRIDLDAVLCCLAPEVDRRYERLYGYLQDDVTRRAPSVDMILSLICGDPERRWDARQRFGPDGPLLRQGLARVEREPGRQSVSLLDRTVQLAPRIAGFLLDDDALEPALRPFVSVVDPDSAPIDPLLPAEPGRRLAALSDLAGGRLLGYLQGDPGSGRRHAVEACARHTGAGLLVVGARLAGTGDFAEVLPQLMVEGRLRRAALYWADADTLLDDPAQTRVEALREELQAYPHPVFLAGAQDRDVTRMAGDRRAVVLRFDRPEAGERVRLWRLVLDRSGPDVEDAGLLAGTFRLTPGQIAGAARAARDLALARDATHPTPTRDDLVAACRAQSGRTLSTVARRVRPRHRWDDLVLPDDQRRRLREIADQIRFRGLVHDTWGFADRVASGRGLNRAVRRPAGHRQDHGRRGARRASSGSTSTRSTCRQVVSKYIGETEKNLARIFAEAAGRQRHPVLRRGRRAVRQAHGRSGTRTTATPTSRSATCCRSMEEYEAGDPRDQPAQEPGRGLRAAPARRPSTSRSRRRRAAADLGGHLAGRRRRGPGRRPRACSPGRSR